MKKEEQKKPMFVVNVPYGFETAGGVLKFMRERAGLTQEQLAKKLNTYQSVVAKRERAKSFPSLRTMQEIGKICGFDMQAPYFACKKCDKNIADCVCKKK